MLPGHEEASARDWAGRDRFRGATFVRFKVSFGQGALVEFRILGPLEVHHRGRTLRLGGLKQRALLATLLLHPNEAVSIDRLIDALWDAAPPPTARAPRGDEEALRHLGGVGS
jgi:hypothetical protein